MTIRILKRRMKIDTTPINLDKPHLKKVSKFLVYYNAANILLSVANSSSKTHQHTGVVPPQSKVVICNRNRVFDKNVDKGTVNWSNSLWFDLTSSLYRTLVLHALLHVRLVKQMRLTAWHATTALPVVAPPLVYGIAVSPVSSALQSAPHALVLANVWLATAAAYQGLSSSQESAEHVFLHVLPVRQLLVPASHASVLQIAVRPLVFGMVALVAFCALLAVPLVTLLVV